jgi:3-hydroxyisobutyrate dehydrogenase-like beta-hydroxyacid dehydrogenase
VGVGRMGGLMAPRLLDKGYKVTVFDKSASAVERLRELCKTSQQVHSRTASG